MHWGNISFSIRNLAHSLGLTITNVDWINKILTNYRRLKIDEDSTGYVLASAGLTEEGVEGVVTTSDSFVTGHLAIGLDSMF